MEWNQLSEAEKRRCWEVHEPWAIHNLLVYVSLKSPLSWISLQWVIKKDSRTNRLAKKLEEWLEQEKS